MNILVFPEDRGNPYQSLLYEPMRHEGIDISYLKPITPSASLNIVLRFSSIIFHRCRGKDIFHIHWVNAFVPSAHIWKTPLFNTFAYWVYVTNLFGIKMLGYKLVWTAHNVMPHEPVFINGKDILARKWLVRLSDLVIVHSETAKRHLLEHGLHPKKIVIIPIGSYVGVYPNTISQKKARGKLHVPFDSFAYLFLGLIRDYKGVDTLITSYNAICSDKTSLIIAGACHDNDLRTKLKKLCVNNVLWREGTVPDEEMQDYFAAADIVVLPFKKMTTSSSALLAFSFEKTVIVPSMGNLSELPASIAYTYIPSDDLELRNIMVYAANHREETIEKGRQALIYAKELSWLHIAKKTVAAYNEMFAS